MRNEYMFEASEHSLARAKERAGLNEKKAKRMIDNAIERGKRAADCHYSSDRKFLEAKSVHGRTAIAYNDWCFIVDLEAKIWITLLELPKDFGKKKSYYRAEKVRKKEHKCMVNNWERAYC